MTATPTAKEGHRVKARRLGMGLKQDQLAAFLGVDQSTVSSWETGRHSIPAHMWGFMERHETPRGEMGPAAVVKLYICGLEEVNPRTVHKLETAGFTIVTDLKEAEGMAFLPDWYDLPKPERFAFINRQLVEAPNAWPGTVEYWVTLDGVLSRNRKGSRNENKQPTPPWRRNESTSAGGRSQEDGREEVQSRGNAPNRKQPPPHQTDGGNSGGSKGEPPEVAGA